MCGIAGIFRRDGGDAFEAQVLAMVAAMPHRGPDGRGTWVSGPVALGHGRLAIRDLGPSGAQPMEAPGGEGVLVYNGEVYEEGPLRAELERAGARFRGTNDAEVVLHAIARWGVLASLPRFDGMFAFAWWDARERVLWLARDRFGIKPLHVVVEHARVLFASEVRGLRAVPGVATRPDLLELARFIVPGRSAPVKPPFEGVESVGPGGVWRISAAGIERHKWFDVLYDVDVDRLLAAQPGDPLRFEAPIEHAVCVAVESHLASDVPVGAFVSGGVDSNLVAEIAHRKLPSLVGYTVDTCDAESEAPTAMRVARHMGLDLKVVRVDRAEHLRLLPQAIEALEHPSTHGSQPEMLALARAARADGIVVALTGEGADELFGGYDFFEKTWTRWHRAHAWWRRWRREARIERAQLAEAPFYYEAARRDPELHGRIASVLSPQEDGRAHALLARLARVEPPEDRAFLAHAFDALHRHLGRILLRHDRIAMAASLESRVPFLSWRVAEPALHLPASAKLRRGVGKWLLKRIAGRRVPPDAVYARKKGFPIPNAHHAGTSALLRGGAAAELFRWPAHGQDHLLARVERDPYLRHQMVSLEVWARLFVRGERADAIADRLLALPAHA